MANKNLVRVSPSLFEDNAVMIGRNKKDKVWKKFTWGEDNSLKWEYAPLTHLNKHLVGTSNNYIEIEEDNNDVVVDNVQEDIDNIVSMVEGMDQRMVGICAMCSLFRYSHLVNKQNFVISDNQYNFLISILNNEQFKIFNDNISNVVKENDI